MSRIVPLPLDKEPELLWGLALGDLLWPIGGVLLDAACFPHLAHKSYWIRYLVLAVPLATGVALATVRWEGKKLGQWSWTVLRYGLSAHRYLP